MWQNPTTRRHKDWSPTRTYVVRESQAWSDSQYWKGVQNNDHRRLSQDTAVRDGQRRHEQSDHGSKDDVRLVRNRPSAGIWTRAMLLGSTIIGPDDPRPAACVPMGMGFVLYHVGTRWASTSWARPRSGLRPHECVAACMRTSILELRSLISTPDADFSGQTGTEDLEEVSQTSIIRRSMM